MSDIAAAEPCWVWCCLCNPFYLFPEEEEDRDQITVAEFSELPLDDMAEEEEASLHLSSLSVSSREADDPFTLPCDYNADNAYYDAYCGMLRDPRLNCGEHNNNAGCGGGEPRAWDGRYTEARLILSVGCEDSIGVARSLALSREEILAAGDRVARQQLIVEYEANMQRYAAGDSHSRVLAARKREDARDERNHTKEKRLLYYQQALFLTHRREEKLVLRKEYYSFCDSLRA
jgi:hypothetical protein